MIKVIWQNSLQCLAVCLVGPDHAHKSVTVMWYLLSGKPAKYMYVQECYPKLLKQLTKRKDFEGRKVKKIKILFS